MIQQAYLNLLARYEIAYHAGGAECTVSKCGCRHRSDGARP